MPVYEYECRACNHRFEEWQKITDKPVKICPKCKARRVERLISQTSFQLKGGGWYGDLYASKRPSNSGDSKPDGDGKTKASSPTESGGAGKTAAPSPAKTGSEASSSSEGGSKARGARPSKLATG